MVPRANLPLKWTPRFEVLPSFLDVVLDEYSVGITSFLNSGYFTGPPDVHFSDRVAAVRLKHRRNLPI